jgi:hypothetical protein
VTGVFAPGSPASVILQHVASKAIEASWRIPLSFQAGDLGNYLEYDHTYGRFRVPELYIDPTHC